MNIQNRHISIWGDSILKGVIWDETAARYQVLDSNCISRFSEITGTTIMNHSSFGMTTGKALDRIKNSILRRSPVENDIVVIEFGGNDCDFNWTEISENPDGDHLPNTPITVFGQKLQEIIDVFKSLNISPILMALTPLDPEKYFAWISHGLNKTNILKWLGDINKIYRWQEAYSDIVVETAKSNNLKLVNVRSNFLVSSDYSSKFCTDGIHPNKAGHEIILDSLLTYVDNL